VVTSTSVIMVTCPPQSTRIRHHNTAPNPIVTAPAHHVPRGQIQPSRVNSWQSQVAVATQAVRLPSAPRPVNNASSGSRWDSRINNFLPVVRPLLPPAAHHGGVSGNHGASSFGQRPTLPGLLTSHVVNCVNVSSPPPPEWQPFLRDLVISLGYRRAASIWPRLARCRLGNYSEEVRREQETYMGWCRETLIGFER
jgi:hypothetical protein